MLDIRFKEAIENGTMCAFVSKDVKFNIREDFLFVEAFSIPKKIIKMVNIKNINRVDSNGDMHIENTCFPNDSFSFSQNQIIAKAECAGVVKFNQIRLYYNEYIFISRGNLISLEAYKLGCRLREDFYSYLEGIFNKPITKKDTDIFLEGYLHIFKLVEGV